MDKIRVGINGFGRVGRCLLKQMIEQLGDTDRLLILKEGKVLREGATDSLVDGGNTLEEALVAWGAAG